MRIITERETEDFLEKQGFKVVRGGYAETEAELKRELAYFNFPLVMKVSSSKIIHKNRLGGVITNIKNVKEANNAFGKLKKIRDFEGVIIQEMAHGKEFLLGIKATPEFGHVIGFGAGGIKTEQLKDASFRVCPFDEKDAEEMIKEVKASKGLNKKEREHIINNILKINSLIIKFPKITELDINPLIVNNKEAVVVDARMVVG